MVSLLALPVKLVRGPLPVLVTFEEVWVLFNDPCPALRLAEEGDVDAPGLSVSDGN